MPTDPRALKTLFDTYWTSAGWKDYGSYHCDPIEFAHARQCGLMFDDEMLHHDDVIRRVIAARDATSLRAVVRAFVSSLSSHRLELRSALGCYAVFRHLQPHDATPVRHKCTVCGMYVPAISPTDLSVLNFERFKWGGVRHDNPEYCMLDLELFLRTEACEPTADDISLLNDILLSIRDAPPGTTSAVIHRFFPKSFKSNKSERDVIVRILGYCGILAPDAHPGFNQRFIHSVDWSYPPRANCDMNYPARWWRAEDGLNRDALAEYFGEFVSEGVVS